MNSKKTILSVLKTIAIILGIIIGTALLLVLILTVAEYRPKQTEDLKISGYATKSLKQGSSFSVLSWNTGYCALGENQDFFFDGGKNVYGDSKNTVYENLAFIENKISSSNCDIILLQETDVNSARSHFIDEVQHFSMAFPNFQKSHATNYKVLFIPFPWPPIGKVECGITTLSAYPVSSSQRIALPCPFTYPTRICNLKRAIMINRIPIKDSDKELVVVNLHLEAYDSGEGKIAQTKLLKSILEEEAAKGNYVIAGGDFNQTFSSTDSSAFPQINDTIWKPGIIDESEFSKKLSFYADSTVPSCRSLDKVYAGSNHDPSLFQYYIIDGFICSNNVKVEKVQTLDYEFKASDHNPVKIQVTLQ